MTLADAFPETHTWNYLLTVCPLVEVEFGQYENWTVELLQKGFCWKHEEFSLDVTFVEREDRQELEEWLKENGLTHSVARYSREHEEA